MKKKVFIPACALTLTLACACGCGGGAVENKEFEEYALQVRTVMYDLGLIAENPQSQDGAGQTLVQGQNLFAVGNGAATFDNNKTAILNLAQGYDNKVERDTLSAYTNAFEQSFYIPLIMGKALADHHKVSTFYGVCANSPWDQYVQTVKDNGTKTTRVYTPEGEVFEKETFIEMQLDYVSKDDYEVRVRQCTYDYSRLYFVYADGETFVEISYEQGNSENCYLSYSLDGFSGFNCKNEQIALQAKNLVQDEFTGVDQTAIRQIKTNAKYTVKEDEWEEANAYYFNGSGEVTQSPYGWADENNTVLSSYRCFETTKRIEIPARVRYLTDGFSIIYDEGVEPAEELYIPKTVIGIKGFPQNENPDPNPDASMPALLNLTAKDLRIQTWNWEPLQNIIVEEGSTLFMAGEGHLRALDGDVVCYLNLPHPTGKVSQTEFVGDGYKLSYDLLNKYPLLTASITELVCDERYIGEIGDMARRFPALQSLHVTFPDPMGEEIRNLQLENQGNVTLYLHAKGSYNLDYYGQGTLTVHLDYKDVRLRISARNSVVYSKWNKVECDLMQALNQPICEGATTIYYEETGGDAYKGISFQNHWSWDGIEAVLDTAQANSFVVPTNVLGYAIKYVIVENSVNTPISVTLPSTAMELRINNTWEEDGVKNYGSNVTVTYDGNRSAFENVFMRSYESPQYIQVVCNDFVGAMNGFVQKVTLINEGAQINETYYLFAGNGDITLTGKKVLPTYNEQKAYYYTDENSKTYNVTNASNNGGTITIGVDNPINPTDITLTYHEKESSVFLEIYVGNGEDDPDNKGGYDLVYSQEVSKDTIVRVEYSHDTGLIITIEHNNNGSNEPKPNDVCVLGIIGEYEGDAQYVIEEDTTLHLIVR